MNDFLQFVSAMVQSPRLALALFVEALQTAWTPLLCAGIMFAGFVALRRRWQKRQRKNGRGRHETAIMPTQARQEDGRDEAAFLAWYASRMEYAARMNASRVVVGENQARWLYAAYLKNVEIIKAQIVSEVES